mgnify:CR=1 FL=1
MSTTRDGRPSTSGGEVQRLRFGPVDLELMRLRARLSPSQRIRTMLDTWELLVGLIRGRLRRHETDIYEMMLFRYMELDPELNAGFDESLVDAQARELGPEVWELWKMAKQAASQEVGRHRDGLS